MDLHHILIVDPEPYSCTSENCQKLSELIRNSLSVDVVHSQTATLFPFDRGVSPPPSLVLLRDSTPMRFPEALRSLRSRWAEISIMGIFCSATATPADIFRNICDGLDDFLCCPFRDIDFLPRIQRFLEGKRTASRLQLADVRLDIQSLVGESACFLSVIEKIPRLARSDATVLILGETGTGKELLAREIHYHSPRQGKPFIPVNCGALPDHLFENELFGHAKGAFTDASSAEKGLIAEAEGGTIFLDEVDSLSSSAQIKLLRFLQDRVYRPLGSPKSISADVRIITATNADLRQLVEAKLFREDLYYRINILSISLPPLRERLDDIPLLANFFLSRFDSQYGRGVVRLSSGAVQKLLGYPWLGNVRELEGVIQRAVILTSSSILQPDDIDLASSSRGEMLAEGFFRSAKTQAVHQFERTYLIEVLSAHDGNITRAAKSAGKERRTFQRLLRKHGLSRRAFQIPK